MWIISRHWAQIIIDGYKVYQIWQDTLEGGKRNYGQQPKLMTQKGYLPKKSAKDFFSLNNDLWNLTNFSDQEYLNYEDSTDGQDLIMERVSGIWNKHYTAASFKLRRSGKENEALLLDKLYDKIIDKSELKKNYQCINSLLLLMLLSDQDNSEDDRDMQQKNKSDNPTPSVLSESLASTDESTVNKSLLKVLMDDEEQGKPSDSDIAFKPISEDPGFYDERFQISGIFKNPHNKELEYDAFLEKKSKYRDILS